ncbi:MAG: DPP IV N-terminal domain-containing protein [Flavitalea sp.]
MHTFKTSIGVLLIIALPASVLSQKKSFTYDQLFKGNYPAIYKKLPDIKGWADDNHYIETRNNNGTDEVVSVDAVSGTAVPYTNPNKQSEATVPTIQGALNITLSPNGKWAAYTKDNNLYSLELSTGKETALSTDGSDTIMNGYASWVYCEEIIGRATHYKAFWWSPDSKHIAFMHFDDSRVPQFPIFAAEGQHGFLEKERYPKAGDTNPEVRIGVTPVVNPSIVWADFRADDDQYFGTPQWTPTNELWVQWMNREQDSLIVYQINKLDGAKKEIYTEHQQTWITLKDDNRFTFLNGNSGCIIKSDKDGWENLYYYDLHGKLISQVTNGNYWKTSILNIDEKNKQVFIRARKDHSNQLDVYKISLNGKTVSKLSTGNYSYDDVKVSPTGKYMIAVYSNLSTPSIMGLMNNKGKQIREIGNLKGTDFDSYDLPRTEIKTVKSSDGNFDLPVAITYPLHFDATKKYPVWIFVYGGPNYSTVADKWNAGKATTQWWAQEGVIQVTMDNRSSGHFGRKGMNYIYKQMGKWEIEDYMSCGRWLRAQSWVDSSKIGITGGSFGGYITCMALTYGADVFTLGIADYSVTDWKLYDTHFTERFMNKPEDNVEGYIKTSVLTYAPKLRGVLRIVHGSTDDNVHMQNTLQFINLLEDLNKPFELMIYPGQRHGIGGTKNAFDLKETSRFVYRYLLGKNLPEVFEN